MIFISSLFEIFKQKHALAFIDAGRGLPLPFHRQIPPEEVTG
jgi:hypothetical protein